MTICDDCERISAEEVGKLDKRIEELEDKNKTLKESNESMDKLVADLKCDIIRLETLVITVEDVEEVKKKLCYCKTLRPEKGDMPKCLHCLTLSELIAVMKSRREIKK